MMCRLGDELGIYHYCYFIGTKNQFEPIDNGD